MAFRYGKRPARPGAVRLRLADYLHETLLPEVPAVFGHQALVGADWGMLGNDSVGDCAWAGAAHETMLWTAEGGGAAAQFTADSVLADYAACTGYDPGQTDPVTGENPTDQGTDIVVAAAYRHSTGVLDANGARHTIGAYVGISRGNVGELVTAAYLFGAVGVGIQVPEYAESQFQRGAVWDVSNGPADIVGGHYIPVVGRDDAGNLLAVTWGRIQPMTPAFYRQWSDEALVYVSSEMLSGTGETPEGFNVAQLQADLSAITLVPDAA